MRKPPPLGFLSSTTAAKHSSTPTILLALLHVISICSSFTFSSWTFVTWIIFISLYIPLWVTTILYILHWHREKNLKEEEKHEQIKSARHKQSADLDKQMNDFEFKKELLFIQKECLKSLLQDPNISEFSCDANPILGDDIHIKKFEHPTKTGADNIKSKIRSIK